jgi:hypothetical protein
MAGVYPSDTLLAIYVTVGGEGVEEEEVWLMESTLAYYSQVSPV